MFSFKIAGNESVSKPRWQPPLSKLTCDICKYIGCKPIDLKKHYEKCQKYHKFVIDMWTCKICNKKQFKGRVFQHLETHHKQEIEAESSETAKESLENSYFNQENDDTNLILQPEKSALVVPKSRKSKALEEKEAICDENTRGNMPENHNQNMIKKILITNIGKSLGASM